MSLINSQKYDFIYSKGYKWCKYCQEKKLTDNLRCPDCNQKLRNKPRKSNFKTT